MDEKRLSQTEALLLSYWRDTFATTEIGLQDDFFVLGGHSLMAARISERVAGVYGFELPLSQVFDTPTISELAEYIDHRRAAQEGPKLTTSALVRLKAGSTAAPLFCVHGLLGSIGDYLTLARLMPARQAVYGVQGRGLVGEKRPLSTVAGMARHCVREIRRIQPHGPYHLAGSSFAGLVAYESAQQLRAAGEEVALLALFDTWLRYDPRQPQVVNALHATLRREIRYTRQQWERGQRAARQHAAIWKSLPASHKPTYLRQTATEIGMSLLQSDGDRSKAAAGSQLVDLEIRHNNILAGSQLAAAGYTPRPYKGRILYFLAEDRTGAPPLDHVAAWKHLAHGGLDLQRMLCDHHHLLASPYVETVAATISRQISSEA